MTQNEKEFIEKVLKEYRNLPITSRQAHEEWLIEKISQAIQFGRTQREDEIKQLVNPESVRHHGPSEVVAYRRIRALISTKLRERN